jgi:hypothetical protein
MRTKGMTTIRRRHVDGDWCYQIIPDDHLQDLDTSAFTPWTELPPEVMCLISLCLMGLQEGLEPTAPDEWRVPSRALKSWASSGRDTARQNDYMKDSFRYEESGTQFTSAPLSTDCEIMLEMCTDPDQASRDWICKGFKVIGRVDAVLRGDGEPPERPAVAQARQVGATVVLYNLWPAKLKAVKRRPDESIDLATLLADPPTRIRSNGSYVVKAVFLRH